ncbi:hypothetical protein [Fictibacillus fluitans]|uniref:Uncharacterized protein n=1 Tax=Fictibacillus fluitans TaxID=3058422 RepID=A0ABT8HX39_9BACL|nr:hypothetical protein [Fictibacillus sp. NE201]MDN4525343.1 hypothetical protein [Fictibacillus sp. NE201]
MASEVKTYFLSPEELEKYRATPKQKGPNIVDPGFTNNVNMALNSWKRRQNTVKSDHHRPREWRWPQNR